MNRIDRIYTSFGNLAPLDFRKKIDQSLIYAGKSKSSQIWIGETIIVCFLVFFATLIVPFSIFGGFDVRFLLLAIGLSVGYFFLNYMLLFFIIESRTKNVDAVLPDFLQLVAANLRAGMTPFQSLKYAARDEFGPLKDEIEWVSSKAVGTGAFSDILLQITDRLKSEKLERSIKLFATAMKSGGHLAELLEEMAADIAQTQDLKAELQNNTKTYSMFIMFTIIIGTPLLLAIGVNFLQIVTDISANVGSSSSDFGLSFLSGDIVITTDFMETIAYFQLAFTGFLAAMLMGVISEGNQKSGLKYAPAIIFAAYVVFFIAKIMVGDFLAGVN